VMPNHVECCTYPVLEWIAEHMPAAPVNVMAQFHPDNFCDPASDKYRDRYAEIRDHDFRAACRHCSKCDDLAAILVGIGNSVTGPQDFLVPAHRIIDKK